MYEIARCTVCKEEMPYDGSPECIFCEYELCQPEAELKEVDSCRDA